MYTGLVKPNLQKKFIVHGTFNSVNRKQHLYGNNFKQILSMY